jgi:hypothetical protein
VIHRPDPRCPLVGDEFIYHGINGSHPYTIVEVSDDYVWVQRHEDPEGTTWRWPRHWILPDIGKQRDV